jgi:Fe-S-cluster-containing dehydrogenase component
MFDRVQTSHTIDIKAGKRRKRPCCVRHCPVKAIKVEEKDIIEHYSGKMEVDIKPGKGSAFIVSLHPDQIGHGADKEAGPADRLKKLRHGGRNGEET